MNDCNQRISIFQRSLHFSVEFSNEQCARKVRVVPLAELLAARD
jgi:hypothetical protein